MKKTSLCIALIAGLAIPAAAEISKKDIIKLAKAGISDKTIISVIDVEGAPTLSVDDFVEMKKAGVSERILQRHYLKHQL